MEINWAPFFTFMIVASFTPGPNNMNAAALGMAGGYRRAFPYVIGVYSGVAFLLIITGFMKMAVSDFFYRYLIVFQILGSAYLLWMAWGLVRTRESKEIKEAISGRTFWKATTLQLVNPKALFFTMMLYSVFLLGDYNALQTVMLGLIIPTITIVAVSTWAMAGTFLSRILEKDLHRRIFYWICAALLIYTVIGIWTSDFAAV